MRKIAYFLMALALMGVVAWGVMYGIRNDDGTGHHQGAVSGDGKPIPLTTDSTGHLWIHIGATEAPAETITWFDKPVATPDTSVPLAAAAANVRAVWMVAKRTDAANAGTVYIRGSTVDKDNIQGVPLAPGDYFEIPIPAGTTIDLNTVYVDADTATDGVCGGYITE